MGLSRSPLHRSVPPSYRLSVSPAHSASTRRTRQGDPLPQGHHMGYLEPDRICIHGNHHLHEQAPSLQPSALADHHDACPRRCQRMHCFLAASELQLRALPPKCARWSIWPAGCSKLLVEYLLHEKDWLMMLLCTTGACTEELT